MHELKVGTGDDIDAYTWLERYWPVETVGKSMRLYYVGDTAAER